MNFFNVLELWGIEIFDDISLPTKLDRDIVIDTIIDKCFYYTPLAYEDKILIPRINNFFKKNYRTYEKLVDAYFLEYDMIENYNKVSEIVKNSNEKVTTNSKRGTTSHNTQEVSAYDNSTYQPSAQDKNVLDDVLDGTNGTVYDDTIKEVTKGNIGVTTTQQMIESEIALREKLRIYDIIANDFFNEFMLKCL